MIACVLIVTNLIGWFFIVQAKDTLLEQCKKNARNSAKIAAERIDGDILGKLKPEMRKQKIIKKYYRSCRISCVEMISNTYIQCG